jgi:hypothetical protein
MKRFFGLVLTAAGGVGVLWGGYHVLIGESTTRVTVADGVSVTALVGGLVGLMLFTVGLVWARD